MQTFAGQTHNHSHKHRQSICHDMQCVMSSFCQLSKTKKQKENNFNFKVFFYNLLFLVKSKTKF